MTTADRRLVILEVFAAHERRWPTLGPVALCEMTRDTLARVHGWCVGDEEIYAALSVEAGFLEGPA